MEITLNTNLSEPTAFFTHNGTPYALLLASHELLAGEMDGQPETPLDFEVEQDWDSETTFFQFEGFTIRYNASGVQATPHAAGGYNDLTLEKQAQFIAKLNGTDPYLEESRLDQAYEEQAIIDHNNDPYENPIY